MAEFHIHIDTKTPSKDLHRAAKDLGFYEHNFSGHPDGHPHFEPTSHSTFKAPDPKTFKRQWSALENLMNQYPLAMGYIEGEYVPSDLLIEEKPIKNYFPPPFEVIRRKVSNDLDPKGFRETEFHLVMDWINSDRRLVDGLLRAGLYGALLDKPDHQAIVLTMQGTRTLILPLMKRLHDYIQEVGGVVRGSLKEEIAIRHQLYNMKVDDLPEVADRII